MDMGGSMNKNPVMTWLGAIVVTLLFFYGLDHFIMAMQGLPLNMNLSPVQ